MGMDAHDCSFVMWSDYVKPDSIPSIGLDREKPQ